MAEFRVSHVLIVLVLLAVIGTPILVLVGWLAIPELDIFGFKTPKIDQDVLNKTVDKGLATASGYTPAKTPNEAMEKFRDAIQTRKYKFAANYCTKPYADTLTRAHDAASELGAEIDRIRKYGTDKGLMTDKLTFVLYRLDPFPANFKIGETPKQDGESKANGKLEWEPLKMKDRNPQMLLDPDIKGMDQKMFNNVLDVRMTLPAMLSFGVIASPTLSYLKVELVKEGEDWKLKIPMNPQWDKEVNDFMDKHKTYHTGLSSFVSNMTREQYDNPTAYERGVFDKLREAKK